MMEFDVGIVEDRGTYWNVTNIVRNTTENLASNQERIVRLSYMAAKMIKDALLAGKYVTIKKPVTTLEIVPGEFDIVDKLDQDELQANKDGAIKRVRMLVTPELAKVSGFALYGFTVLNNDLASNGFFITNENREEKYLEILETGDEKLIAKLEDYLNYKDEIESVAALERKFSKFRTEIKSATTVEEVNTVADKFLEEFYQRF